MFPRRKQTDLIVRQVADETLIYDEGSSRAHCLNRVAGLVWEMCDGATAPEQISMALEEAGFSGDLELVTMSLRKLHEARLLDSYSDDDPAHAISRRALAKRLGLAAAIALPLVSTIVAPTALAAVSCVPRSQLCAQGNTPCCPGLVCGDKSHRCN